ncbi:MAG: ABC transporter substrate-binding protein [Rhodospirillales bacterium]|nr:ABC transporter substrate-binding protein [Rhodospirillales bacterium]MDE2573815.1 ABC transporter substrate-binding protein [Rhodospirillales bacterium]
MTSTTRRRIFLMLTAMSAVGLAGGLPPAARAASGDLKVGVIGPMTGANAPYGSLSWRGASLAAKEINAAGGVLGHKIELVRGDSQCTPVEGVLGLQRMISSDHIQFVLGDICSSATLAYEPIVENAKVLLINAASSDPTITYKAGVGGYKWTFRNYPTDEQRAGIVLKYASEQRHLHKIAILSVDNDYGRGAIALSKKFFQRYGITVVSEDYFQASTTEFLPELNKIKSSGAQAILMYGYAASSRLVARQMLESGLAGKIALIGNGDFTNPQTIKAAPSVLNGAIEAAAWSPDYDSARSKSFVHDYEAAYGGEVPQVHAFTHWETINLLAAAIRKAGSVDPAAVKQALAGISFDGATGVVKFDNHDQADLPMILYQVDNGKPVIKGVFRTAVVYPKP